MHIQSYQYTPTGYRSPIYDIEKKEPEPDYVIARQWHILNADHTGKANTLEFIRKTINRALDLLRYLPDWLEAQENNPRLTPHMRAFLEDTIDFINTGRRKMDVVTRAGCIYYEINLTKRPVYRTSRSAPKLRKMLNVDGLDYMYNWLNHPRGFDDMLATVNVFFGSIDSINGSDL